jgi:hypothetical protein
VAGNVNLIDWIAEEAKVMEENPMTAVANGSVDSSLLTTIDYARALRAIGQDLSELYPKTFEIETDGENFIARGESHPDPFKQNFRRRGLARLWRTLGVKSFDDEKNGSATHDLKFSRSYTSESIHSLDQSYSSKRTGQLSRPDNYSLAERLRTLGGIVKARNGKLMRVRKDGDQFFADYWNERGELATAKLTTVILYRNQQQTAPGSETQELWEGYDF